ncbi:rna-directed dna polymerase from mobile element jockey-like [Willisornis vidua]|uniref:Rna-directed dna polymerase from mobile element jockey-like n=1 Tax=Willisornis vidua TaxID=1566151 RepID=A0ABQ9CZ03_9PASS|nr:rna-directed dna polymerase from mobile element jockey-like [Willisornis vidua]
MPADSKTDLPLAKAKPKSTSDSGGSEGKIATSARDRKENIEHLIKVNGADDRSRRSQCPELEDHDCERDPLPVDPEIVQDLLLHLDPFRFRGLDGIHPKILKKLSGVITKPLSIFEWSYKSRKIPADWKLASAVPIFKKGQKEGPRNYRAGSILGLVLFNIFIKDLEKGLEVIFSKFANDIKLGGAVDSFEGKQALQRDLNKLEDWAITNHVKFNKGKCQILHLEWGNPGCTQRLGNEILESSATERDLEVLVSDKLNMSQ